MDIFNHYDIFKEKCFSFSSKFENNCFEGAKFICHPTVENEIISVCSDEESKSNGLNICRLSDMLLMSEDSENWKTFNLKEARNIAEEKGYVYLTDLLFEDAFIAEDWMINGKHDTIIVNEQYMREKGMKYAPVTPLTNKVLHFKKTINPFFWTKAEKGELVSIDSDYITSRFDAYLNEFVDNIPSFSAEDDISFKLFDGNVTINSATTLILKADLFFSKINEVVNLINDTSEILLISEYEFDLVNYIKKIAISVLNNNNITVTENEFDKSYNEIISKSAAEKNKLLEAITTRSEDEKIDIIKLVFIDTLKSNSSMDFNSNSYNTESYYSQMRNLEQKDFDDAIGSGEEKFIISNILSNHPTDYAIFAYTLKRYPEEEGNLAEIADFWGIEKTSEKDLQAMIFSMYLNNELFDENGNFISGIDQAEIIKNNLIKVNSKYGFEDMSYINELEDYIVDMDLKRRSYNGTVFDTEEDMKRAMANELELQALCIELSALDESELIDLRKHINGITIDEATKAKYLVKVKVAMNRCEESMLEQLCLGLPMMDADEIIKLHNDVIKSGYAESVVKPKLADINDYLNSALKKELDKKISGIDNMNDEQLLSVINEIKSDRYPAVLSEEYLRNIEIHIDNKIKSDINKICSGMENFDIEQLTSAKKQLIEGGYPEKYTIGLINEINTYMSDYEKNEVIRLFENIDFADEEEIASIKKKIAEKNYAPDLIAPYNESMARREQELIDEELISICEGIEEANQEQLDELKLSITDESKKYNEELKVKSLERIERRECELKNSELAELCKYIFSMEQDKLDELKNVLLSDKYDESLTTIYLKKVTEREDELRRIELDTLCENINEMTEEELIKLKDDISSNDAYIAISDPYFEKIDNCIVNLKNAEYNKLLETVPEMDTDALEKFKDEINSRREEIGDELYQKGLERAEERANAIELEKLDEIIADIDNFDIAKSNEAIETINSTNFKAENKEQYIEKINDKIEQLYLSQLDLYVENIDNMTKEQLVEVKLKIQNYDCPAELKATYSYKIDKKIDELAEDELRRICGDVGSLSVKKSMDVIVKIRTMTLDDRVKNQYLDSIDAHIMQLRNNEQNDYIEFLKGKINEFSVSTVNFLVPTISNLFVHKYDEACRKYVSAGRYELPIFLHENSADSGFTLTTEYFYFINKGVINRIKIDDIVSFQPKKGLMASSIVVSERNGNTSEISCSINKNAIEATTKAMTAVVNHIREQRSAEHMKELLENAVNERTQELAIPKVVEPETPAVKEPVVEETPVVPAEEKTAEPETASEEPADSAENTQKDAEEPAVEEVTEEPKVRFCDQCGAKIASKTAKFCAECGNKLF